MKPVFIAGTGRSGTTILRKCLSLHPEVASMPGELRIISDPSGILDVWQALYENWDPYKADIAVYRFHKFLMQVTSDSNDEYLHHNTDEWTGGKQWYEKRVNKLIDEITIRKIPARWVGGRPARNWRWETAPLGSPPPLRDCVRDLYIQRNKDGKIFVDDTPYSACHKDRLKKVFGGDIKIVWCIRDPKDIYSSFLHGGKHWTPKDPELAADRISNIIDQSCSEAWGIGWYDKWVDWKLEEFVLQPKKMFAKLCTWLNISTDYISSCLLPLDSGKAHIGRYKDELSNEELEIYKNKLQWAERLFCYE